MDPEKLREAWQSQPSGMQIHIDSDELLKAVRVSRRIERLNSVLIRRDVVETVAAVVVIIFFGRYCYTAPADYLVSKTGAGFLVCWAVFAIYKLHRTRTIQQPAALDAPLSEYCRVELERLDRQIQLLRSVAWWYIAPCIVGVNIMYVGLAGFGISSLVYCLATLLLVWVIYALNMRAIAKSLLPPRNELAGLLGQLESAGIVEERIESPPKREHTFSVIISLVTLVVLAAVIAVFVGQPQEYPKLAPFSGIRWEENQPVIKVGEEWFTLVSLDGVPVEEIVAFSRWTFVDKWRKRFAEDLVEVLTRMGHRPKDTVRLVVSPLGSHATRTLEDVPMTKANRWAVYNAAPNP